jgi:hypothetical protein
MKHRKSGSTPFKKGYEEIPLSLSIEDFKKYFRSKQEPTACSPSGRHMGHYKMAVECIHHEFFTIPKIIIGIAKNISHCSISIVSVASCFTSNAGKGKGPIC